MACGHVLDAGCGDGKNSLFLEQQGYKVFGVDASESAIEGLHNRFARADRIPTGRYEVRDVRDIELDVSFDVLVSCGLFHCLPPERRFEMHRRLQTSVRHGGMAFFSCLTDVIPLSSGHDTAPTILPDEEEITALFEDWEVQYRQQTIIDDRHPPLIGPHQHSVARLIARRV
jgi:2-polyprenyl-3-methyl-5-hydroxy-6-metoxy-1,4-benzoquinol methylase